MEYEDLYKVLQVDPAAEPEVISAAYRRLAQKYHPDANSSPSAARRMQQLNRAYNILKNAEARRRYDQLRLRARARRDAQRISGGEDGAPAENVPPEPEPMQGRRRIPGSYRVRRMLFACFVFVGSLTAVGTGFLLLPPATANEAEEVKSVWVGQWNDQEGNGYSCKIKLKIGADQTVAGTIEWTLVRAADPEMAAFIGSTATAKVKGSIDSDGQLVHVSSYRNDDPGNIVPVTEYHFTLALDHQTLRADTFSEGDWQGSITARRTR